jgi:succinate dehydrogenase/fumarate reductase flavoprotein subunit
MRVECDVLVVGSGGGGLAVATASAHLGLKVIVAEKDKFIGGTTALSGGFMWIPCAPVSIAAGVKDSREAAEVYLRDQAGNHYNEDCAKAFLQNGPLAAKFFEENTALKFDAAPAFSDYHPEAPGGKAGGRSIVAKPYDARNLGKEVSRLRPPLPELTLFGMIIGTGPDLMHFTNATRSIRSALYVAKRLLGHARDLAFHGRSMRLTNGGALAGRLLKSALDAGVDIRTNAQVLELLTGDGVSGAKIQTQDGVLKIFAKKGVVLAAGGFPQDKERRAKLFPHDKDGQGHISPAPTGNTGDGLRLGEGAGAVVDESYPNAAAWVPLSQVPRKDGSRGVFPHFIDRGKPGLIAVNSKGKRFANEANSYHDFMQGLFTSLAAGERPRAFLIVDHKFIRRFGLGFVKPYPLPLGGHLRSGYLKRGTTIEELADKIGVPVAAFRSSLDAYNADARRGVDSQFGKGSTAYNRFYGDPESRPNPCIAPIENGPFYAVEIVVGDLGTFAGLKTNGKAQVLDKNGKPIRGLYACGNDMASLMGGNYPGGGITLGPALTFAYIAARELAGQ